MEQKCVIVKTVVAAAKGRVPVVAGVAATTTVEAVRQEGAFESMGCDGIPAVMEAYFPVSDEATNGYFRAVAEASNTRRD